MAVRFSQAAPATNLASVAQQSSQTIGNLFDNFMGAYAGTQELMQNNEIRGARQSLADLGTTPEGGLDYSAAAQRLLSAGDIRGSQALADLGLAQEDRAFRQMQYENQSRQWQMGFDADQAYRQAKLGSDAAGFRLAAPEEASQYGAASGQFGPDGRFYPAEKTEKPAPKTETIYDEETGQSQTVEWNGQSGVWRPLGGVKKAAPRPVPVAVQNAEAGDLQDIQTISQNNDILGRYEALISTGKLSLGGIENIQSRLRNLANRSNENSRNFQSFYSDMNKMRNESLRLNKGVQTEGDAVRAWDEMFSNLNDPEVVSQRLGEIRRYNEAAANFKANQINLRRSMNQLDPLDVTTIVTPSVSEKDTDRVLPRVTTAKQYESLKPGDQYTAPDGSVRTKK